jgi:uncharacterized repeat protein (TIGR01451 family)
VFTSKLSSIISRLNFTAIAALFVVMQVATAVSLSSTASAAKPTSSIASTGFVLTGAYSVSAGQPTGIGSFKNGNVGAYPEGACIPALFQVTNTSASAGDIDVTPVIDYLKVGAKDEGFTKLEAVTNKTAADPAADTNLNQLNFSGAEINSSNVNFKTTANAPVAANVTGPFAGNDSTTTAPTSSDTFRHYDITLTSVPAGATVNVLLCGRLGLDASEYNGSSLSIRTVEGGAENVPIPVNSILVLPSITITKTVTQGGALPSDFSFNVSPSVNGQSTFSIPVGQTSVTVNNVNPDGTYTVTESGPAGYKFTGGSGTACTVVAGSLNTAAGQMSATVAAGKPATNATCNFTNTVNTGSLTIIKDAAPNDTQDFSYTTTNLTPSSFTLDDDNGVVGADNTHSNTQAFNNLVPGTYSVTESATSGWDMTSLSCGNATGVTITGSQVSVNLTAGQNVTCTYTNTKKGHLIVGKTTLPAGDTTSFGITASSSTGGTITGSTTGSITDATDKDYEVTPGTYSVAETATAGWSKTGDTCQNVVVAAGATVHCTITNTKLAKLKIIKDAVPNSSQDFAFTTTGSGLSSFMLDDDADGTLPNNQQFSNLNPGNYSVTEGTNTGWDLTGMTCTGTGSGTRSTNTANITLAAGDDLTCTFTNTQRGSITGFKYESNADSSTGSGLGGWTINLLQNNQIVNTTTTANDGSFSFSNLVNGVYSLTEGLQSGWTQIFAPGGITLSAGQISADNNFGNFHNGSIGGYKFNDLNGDGVKAAGEPKLAGWTMTLYNDNNDPDNLLNNVVSSQQTDVNGDYNFTNLAPGSYQVCETVQAGWTQTLPGNDGCYVFTIDQSGESNQAVFGNQGRGTIKVVKNVDTDGNGTVDLTDVTDWTWDIDGNGSFATGSASPQSVAAGNYTVNEHQKTNFHVSASSCTNESVPNQPITALSVTVSPGENVTCTYTNSRDTGSLNLIKHVSNTHGGTAVAADFTLHVKQGGVDVAGSPAAGTESGTSYTLTTGSYTVSENTPVTGYEQTSIICDGQATATVSVTSGVSKTCTITNSDIAPQLIVKKHAINDNSGTSSASDFTMTVTGTNVAPSASFAGDENGTTVTLNAGSYSVEEGTHSGYNETKSADCSGSLTLGQTKTCTITNNDIPHPHIHVVKSGPTTAHEGDKVTYTFTVTNTGDTPLSSLTVSDDIAGSGVYQSGDTNSNGKLDLTETWVYTKDYTIPADQTANIENTVTACGTDPDQTEVCDTDNHTLDVLHPDITVVKHGPLYGYEGQLIGYTFVVTNTGDTTLYDVGISDDIANLEKCDDATLAPNASTNCTASFLIPTPQIPNVVNEVTASGTDSLDETVTSKDNHTLDVLHPAIKVVKSGPTTAHEGDKVTYTFTVTNEGDIALSSLTVSDNVAGDGVYQSGDDNHNNKLDLDETWVYTKDYTIPADQNDDVVNTVTACGLDPIQANAEEPDPTCDTDEHHLDVLHPSIEVSKYGPSFAHEGDTVGYTFVVTNTGDTTLYDVGISDDIANLEHCDDDTLAPWASTNCTASYVIPADQIDDVINTVTASGTDSLQQTVTAQDDHTLDVLHPSIHVVKTGPAKAQVGDTVTYTFTVTNTGDIPLGGLTVSDNVSGDGLYQSGDTNHNDTLDLDETWIYTKDYVVPVNQQGDIDNTVTACGLEQNQIPEEVEFFAQLLPTKTCDTDTHHLEVLHPAVLAESTTLVNTGSKILIAQYVLPVLLILTVGISRRASRGKA